MKGQSTQPVKVRPKEVSVRQTRPSSRLSSAYPFSRDGHSTSHEWTPAWSSSSHRTMLAIRPASWPTRGCTSAKAPWMVWSLSAFAAQQAAERLGVSQRAIHVSLKPTHRRSGKRNCAGLLGWFLGCAAPSGLTLRPLGVAAPKFCQLAAASPTDVCGPSCVPDHPAEANAPACRPRNWLPADSSESVKMRRRTGTSVCQ